DTGWFHVDDHEPFDLVTRRPQLTSHLERHPSSSAVTTEEIWATRLHRSHLGDVVRGHLLHARVYRRFVFEPLGFEHVERTTRPELYRQITKRQRTDEKR